MLDTARAFKLPPNLENAAGRIRTVGVEIEFAGLTAEEAARRIARHFGGVVVSEDAHAFRVRGTPVGDLKLELDSRFAHAKPGGGPVGWLKHQVASWFGAAAAVIVPAELATDPIPIPELSRVDEVVEVLRDANASGTQDALVFAFGLHFNPEVPSEDLAVILAVFRSFLLLNAWLRRECDQDATRSFLGFAEPFSTDYVRAVIDPGYAPSTAAFIDDYLAANGTRNRDLDLLPLLLFLDEDRVRTKLPNEKIGRRPTFHYRLPDARVSDPGWSIGPDWNRWVAVERTAADADRLAALTRDYLAFRGSAHTWADRSAAIAFD